MALYKILNEWIKLYKIKPRHIYSVEEKHKETFYLTYDKDSNCVMKCDKYEDLTDISKWKILSDVQLMKIIANEHVIILKMA